MFGLARALRRPAPVAFAFLLAAGTAAPAAVPADPAARLQLIGQPAALRVQPEAVTLTGPRAVQQVVVTGQYADGSVRDLTPFSDLTVETADVAAVDAGGFLRPNKSGSTALVVRAGPQTAHVPVTVVDFEKPKPVSFRHDLIASLNVGGCNAGACHGTPSGKNGFRLSLRGYDPAADYLQLTRDVFGRRTDPHDAWASLLMMKALGRTPHEGGARFGADTVLA